MAPSRETAGVSNGLDKVTKKGIPFTYPCQTQDFNETKTHKGNPAEINLGFHKVIPRWKAGSVIKWVLSTDNFESPEDASYAEEQLVKATETWNDMKLGVIFLQVDEAKSAVFVLRYSGDNGTTLADAFFPSSKLSNELNVYSRAFEGDTRGDLDKVFQHELGHVLGLRHEFAAEEGDFVLFGEENPSSVMAYNWPPQITAQDIKETQDFYAWNKPEISSEANSYTVVDHLPRGGK